MNIVLWGFHEAGYRALRKLHAAGHNLIVFTEQAPRYIPSVAELASALNIPLYVGLPVDRIHDVLAAFRPDVGISMYYPRVLEKQVISLPRVGAFNFHPSLLPKHRGCFSAPWAIIEGDSQTGVTCHEMVARVDRGRILCQSRVLISKKDTAFSLYYKLVDSAINLMDEMLVKVCKHPSQKLELIEQEVGGCFHRREIPFGGRIDTLWPEDKVDRFVRAMYFPPHAPAVVEIAGTFYPVTSLNEYKKLVG